MAQELGKIERPTAESFEGTRKLFLVPLVYSPPEPPEGYGELLDRYWSEVQGQLRRLVDRTGSVSHVYHDGVFQEGEIGAKTIEQLNPRSHAVVAEYLGSGARVEALEDQEIFFEVIDWQRVLMLQPASRNVLELAMNSYREALKRRNETAIHRIEQTLAAGESGILLVPEEHGLQFPRDIQVFYVAPPALDEIHRWLRDREAAGPADNPTA